MAVVDVDAQEEGRGKKEEEGGQAAQGEPIDPALHVPQGEASIPQPERTKKRGGGPKTAEGKAMVARNALKHGILAETPVLLRVERVEEWEALRQDVFDFFDLRGPMLETLGDRAAGLIWRLKRLGRFETEATAQYQEDVPADWYRSLRLEGRKVPGAPSKADVEEMNRMLMARLLPGDEVIGKVMRYETKVHRFLLQTLYQIMVLKGLKRSPTSRFFGVAELNPPGVSAKNSPPGFQGDGGE